MTIATDFGALPPEVNSAKIYSGRGSASMLSAATAWNGLAADLRSAAASSIQATAVTGIFKSGSDSAATGTPASDASRNGSSPCARANSA